MQGSHKWEAASQSIHCACVSPFLLKEGSVGEEASVHNRDIMALSW